MTRNSDLACEDLFNCDHAPETPIGEDGQIQYWVCRCGQRKYPVDSEGKVSTVPTAPASPGTDSAAMRQRIRAFFQRNPPDQDDIDPKRLGDLLDALESRERFIMEADGECLKTMVYFHDAIKSRGSEELEEAAKKALWSLLHNWAGDEQKEELLRENFTLRESLKELKRQVNRLIRGDVADGDRELYSNEEC